MSDTAFVVAEIIVGLALLGLLSAVVTVVMVRLLTPAPPAAEILQKRYALGDLTREQFMQMREDLGMTAVSGNGVLASQADGRDVIAIPGPRQDR